MYNKKLHIHFVGIGGIGMSGIAHILVQQGYTVSGSDLSISTPILEKLRTLGCTIFVGHDAANVKNADVIVYSSDVKQSNPEIQAALLKDRPVIPRALMLAELMRTKYSVAVSGSHGKTTTTSLISHLFLQAKRDPTILIGGVLKNISSHAQLGTSDVLIAEADESDRSFLLLNPTTAIVTNIDREHLNTYKDLDDIKQAFNDFLSRLPFYGKGIICIDDENIRSILPLQHIQLIKYGLSNDADIRGEIVSLDPFTSTVDIYITHHCARLWNITCTEKEILLGRVIIGIPGIHNVQNGLAAIALCLEYGLSFEEIQNGLKTFSGVGRRFEKKGTFQGATVFDDYGHHPTEILHTIDVAKKHVLPGGRLIVFFEPHRYSRTKSLWPDFIQVLRRLPADMICITNIYGSIEAPIENITSKQLVKEINNMPTYGKVLHIPTYDDVQYYIKKHAQQNDVIISLGAGKMYTTIEQLIELK